MRSSAKTGNARRGGSVPPRIVHHGHCVIKSPDRPDCRILPGRAAPHHLPASSPSMRRALRVRPVTASAVLRACGHRSACARMTSGLPNPVRINCDGMICGLPISGRPDFLRALFDLPTSDQPTSARSISAARLAGRPTTGPPSTRPRFTARRPLLRRHGNALQVESWCSHVLARIARAEHHDAAHYGASERGRRCIAVHRSRRRASSASSAASVRSSVSTASRDVPRASAINGGSPTPCRSGSARRSTCSRATTTFGSRSSTRDDHDAPTGRIVPIHRETGLHDLQHARDRGRTSRKGLAPHCARFPVRENAKRCSSGNVAPSTPRVSRGGSRIGSSVRRNVPQCTPSITPRGGSPWCACSARKAGAPHHQDSCVPAA